MQEPTEMVYFAV